MELLPLTLAECQSNPVFQKPTLWDFLFHGSYPRPYQEHLDTSLWYNSYIRTYLERDVRSLINVKDLSKFQLFLKLCAGRHGQLLNMTALAQETGISQTSVAQWLRILEASYLVYRLQPYYRNFNKRLVKTAKLYFYDSAIVCMLLGIESPQHLALHASRGAIFEGFVLTEIIKTYKAKGKTPALYFWRDHLGMEIDGLIEKGNQLIALEAKSGKTITSDAIDNLLHWNKIAGEEAYHSCLIYAGNESYKKHAIQVLPWDRFINPVIE